MRTTLSQRALVVIISALDGSAGDATMIRTLAALDREHTVVLASALDPELEELRSTRDDTNSVYVAASAEKDLVEMHAVRRRLSHGGVEVVEAPDQGLAPALADCTWPSRRRGVYEAHCDDARFSRPRAGRSRPHPPRGHPWILRRRRSGPG